MTGAVVAGLVLAGGRGRRLGAAVPKPLVDLAGRPLIAHVLARFPPCISPILISANDPAAFAGLGLPVAVDRVAGFQGPLAGLDAGAAYLRQACPDATHVLSLPGDTPFLPFDLADRMIASPGRVARIARDRGRLQPTIGLWPLAVLDRLPNYLAETGTRSMMAFAQEAHFEEMVFHICGNAPHDDPFFNVNTPEELMKANMILRV